MKFLSSILSPNKKPIKTKNDFWVWFEKNQKYFFKTIKNHHNIERDFFDKISPKLKELNDGVFYLAGMCDDTTAELILTPDGVIKNIAFIEELVEAAPHIPGWKFTALKPALSIDNVKIEMDGYVFDKDTLSFYSIEHKNYPDEIDIVVAHSQFKKEHESVFSSGVCIFLDNLLGEMEFATTIDKLKTIDKAEAERELVPIEKLKAFLTWRQKEFLEKYEGERHNTENDSYASYESSLKDSGKKLIAIINTTLLDWDRKASHPWLMIVKLNFKGDESTGMPDEITYSELENFENQIMDQLKDSEGYLNVGRETGDNLREIYFACKEFRKPSKVLHNLTAEYLGILNVSFDIYKDKYWQNMNRYR